MSGSTHQDSEIRVRYTPTWFYPILFCSILFYPFLDFRCKICISQIYQQHFVILLYLISSCSILFHLVSSDSTSIYLVLFRSIPLSSLYPVLSLYLVLSVLSCFIPFFLVLSILSYFILFYLAL